jgi:hypothetical protein
VEVHVLVTGAYLLKLHQERVSLAELLAPLMPQGRSEEYVIYAVLDAMVGSAFDALNDLELALDDLAVTSTDLRAGRLRMATLRTLGPRLSQMRRRFGPPARRLRPDRRGDRTARRARDRQRTPPQPPGPADHPVGRRDRRRRKCVGDADRSAPQRDELLADGSRDQLPAAHLHHRVLRDDEWMAGEIDTQLAFWLLGVGAPVAGVLLILRVVARGSPGG